MTGNDENERESVLTDLSRLLNALQPYNSDIVLAGGLVPLLYRLHPRSGTTSIEPLHTKDIDLTVPESLSSSGKPTLRELLDDDDFNLVQTRQTSFDAPPKHFVQHARYDAEELAPIHAEFLAPLKGAPSNRDNQPKSPFYLEEKLTAERLRYLDLLLFEPIDLKVDSESVPGVQHGFNVQLPQPLHFILQKILSCDKRNDIEKERKDYAYIYDVVLLCKSKWENMSAQLDTLKDEFHDKWLNRAGDKLQKRFKDETVKGTRGVSWVYGAEQVQAKTVVRVMSNFLTELGYI